MIQVIPQGSAASNIGSSIGRGLGSALTALADTHLQKLVQKEQRKDAKAGLEALGYSKDEAAKLSQFDPQILQEIVKERAKGNNRQATSAPGLQALIPELSAEDAAKIGTLTPSIQAAFYKNYLSSPPLEQQSNQSPHTQQMQNLDQVSNAITQFANPQSQQQQPGLEDILSLLRNPKTTNPIDQLMKPHAISGTNKEQSQQKVPVEAPKEEKPLARRLQEARSEKEREFIRKKEEAIAQKETKPYWDSITKIEKAAEENDLRLDKIKKLVKNGKLPNAALWSFLTKMEDTGIGTLATAGAGIGALAGAAGGPISLATIPAGAGTGGLIGGAIGALASPLAGAAKSLIRATSPDIEEFEKTSNDFVKNAKQYFGSRLTDADLRAFMSTVPTLMQTDAGKLKVAENLQEFNALARSEAKIAREIVKKNNGKRPFDLEQQVQERLGPQKDRLARKFKGEEEVL